MFDNNCHEVLKWTELSEWTDKVMIPLRLLTVDVVFFSLACGGG